MSKLNMNVKPEKTNEITISKQTSTLKFIERVLMLGEKEGDQLSRAIGEENERKRQNE